MVVEKENITQGQIISGLRLVGKTCDKPPNTVIDEYLLGTSSARGDEVLGCKGLLGQRYQTGTRSARVFSKVESTSGDVGWHGVPLLRGLGFRGPKDEAYFVEEPETAEQDRGYKNRQKGMGLLWCGLNRGDKLGV